MNGGLQIDNKSGLCSGPLTEKSSEIVSRPLTKTVQRMFLDP
jgi:hypothetical protein